jgi:hypothetical protein
MHGEKVKITNKSGNGGQIFVVGGNSRSIILDNLNSLKLRILGYDAVLESLNFKMYD